ncbi:MAG: tRNA-(ms[2]io[6]A)-hydroxylase, partial [SAR86 cluster bacterium]
MTKNVGNELAEIEEFLHCSTPQAWLEAALKNQPLLLIDHANCERKAASTAITLMYRHMGKTELLVKMSQLAREELLHFQQVVEILSQRNIEYVRISPSRYAAGLISHIGRPGDQSLIDTLIVGAIIEARSCERFSKLYPLLDAPLSKFYKSLLKSEARHYQDYLQLAQLYSAESIA